MDNWRLGENSNERMRGWTALHGKKVRHGFPLVHNGVAATLNSTQVLKKGIHATEKNITFRNRIYMWRTLHEKTEFCKNVKFDSIILAFHYVIM